MALATGNVITCEYYGHCYAEHLNPNKCNGNPNSLKWWAANEYRLF